MFYETIMTGKTKILSYHLQYYVNTLLYSLNHEYESGFYACEQKCDSDLVLFFIIDSYLCAWTD